jgi:hypothetical protein
VLLICSVRRQRYLNCQKEHLLTQMAAELEVLIDNEALSLVTRASVSLLRDLVL